MLSAPFADNVPDSIILVMGGQNMIVSCRSEATMIQRDDPERNISFYPQKKKLFHRKIQKYR